VKLLVISPEYASHYGPLAVLAGTAASGGAHVVVATGPGLRPRLEADGFEWRHLRLGASSNTGVMGDGPPIRAFVDATRAGPLAAIRLQALERERDLLWNPERVAVQIAGLCADLNPEDVLVDHVSLGSILAMRATGQPFMTLVPGHSSQVPVGAERYGIPARWPACMAPDPAEPANVERVVDRVTGAFTRRWNHALAGLAPRRPRVDDAFRVHGRRVLYNSVAAVRAPERDALLPADLRPRAAGGVARRAAVVGGAGGR